MFGQLLGAAIRTVTLPLDAVSIGADMLAGGDGSKRSRTDGANPVSLLEELRDKLAETADEI